MAEPDELQLIAALWGWPICPGCITKTSCGLHQCQIGRLSQLQVYLTYCRFLIRAYGIDQGSLQRNVLTTPKDLFSLIKTLKLHPHWTQAQFAASLCDQLGPTVKFTSSEVDKALRLAMRILLMIDCTGGLHVTDELESAKFQATWKMQTTLEDFVSEQFYPSTSSIFAKTDVYVVEHASKSLRATNLVNIGRVQFRPTDDMSHHLQFDRQTRTVEIFHHTSFVKAYLFTSKPDSSGQAKRILFPRQLALEILDSIQKVIFNLHDEKSRKILRKLISKSGFDHDCASFESGAIRTNFEHAVPFYYLGQRLETLLREVENPPALGYFEKWLEKRSGDRYVMFAALAGIFAAVLLGILALGLAAVQTWISYQAWKHPVNAS